MDECGIRLRKRALWRFFLFLCRFTGAVVTAALQELTELCSRSVVEKELGGVSQWMRYTWMKA